MTMKDARIELGLTARELATLLGIESMPNYYRLENSRRQPTKQMVAALQLLLWIKRQGLMAKLLTPGPSCKQQ